MTLVPRAINSAHLATGMRGRYHPGGDGSDLDEGRRQARAHREDGVLGQEAGWSWVKPLFHLLGIPGMMTPYPKGLL